MEGRMKKRVYVAGPMSGYENWNFEAFDAAAADLRQRGYEVINPVDLDRDVGFDPATSSPDDFDLPAAIRRDVEALVTCQAIVMLPGHENSKGATAERHVAQWVGIDVLVYPSLAKYGDESLLVDYVSGSAIHFRESLGDKIVESAKILKDHETTLQAIPIELAGSETQKTIETDEDDILSIAYRITRGDRQSSYGPPDQDFRRTAEMWTALFKENLKDGKVFEPFHVAQFMILIKMSRQLHQRKADNWVDVAGYARCGWICDKSAAKSAAESVS